MSVNGGPEIESCGPTTTIKRKRNNVVAKEPIQHSFDTPAALRRDNNVKNRRQEETKKIKFEKKDEKQEIRTAGNDQKSSEIQRISDRVRDNVIKTEEQLAGTSPEVGVKYDAQFDLVNILMLGTTASGKTHLSRVLIKKGFFKNLTRVYCVSTIKMSAETLAADNKNFPSHMRVRHYRINTASDLSDVIDTIKGLCELDQSENPDVRSLIIFDDVISVGNKCNAYYTFLTYCRKFNTSTINIYQAIVNQSNAWKVIVSNCPILVMFQLGFTGTMAARILNSVISMRGATTNSQSWLNRLFIDTVVTNSNYGHLFIDVTPSKAFNVASVRTDIANIFFQRCFAGNPVDEKEYRSFISARESGSTMIVKSIQDAISPESVDIAQKQDNSNFSEEKTGRKSLKRKRYRAEEEKKIQIEAENREKNSILDVSQRQRPTRDEVRRRKSTPVKSHFPSTSDGPTSRATTYFDESHSETNESESGRENPSHKEKTYKSRNGIRQSRLSSRRAKTSSRGLRRASFSDDDRTTETETSEETGQSSNSDDDRFKSIGHRSTAGKWRKRKRWRQYTREYVPNYLR